MHAPGVTSVVPRLPRGPLRRPALAAIHPSIPPHPSASPILPPPLPPHLVPTDGVALGKRPAGPVRITLSAPTHPPTHKPPAPRTAPQSGSQVPLPLPTGPGSLSAHLLPLVARSAGLVERRADVVPDHVKVLCLIEELGQLRAERVDGGQAPRLLIERQRGVRVPPTAPADGEQQRVPAHQAADGSVA